MMDYEQLVEAIKSLDWVKKKEAETLLNALIKRKNEYGILENSLDRNPVQKALLEFYLNQFNMNVEDKQTWVLLYWGNGVGKTHVGASICNYMAMWEEGWKLGLPKIGSKKTIWIGTESGANVRNTIDKYLLWEGSPTRIPPDMIDWNPHYDNKILKWLKLKNWCEISILTYDQGYEKWQGGNPDFMWLDEEPKDERIFTEARMRMRKKGCEMLITMTPLNGETCVYEHFIANPDPKDKVFRGSSFDNPFIDMSAFRGLTDEEKERRIEGSFRPSTGIVYKEFTNDNIIDYFDPSDRNEYKIYMGIDFGVSHPTWVIFLAVDRSYNFYIFNELLLKDTTLSDILRDVKQVLKPYKLEFAVRDSASKREWLEFQRLWFPTIPADKKSKGINDMSNRRAGILMINNLLANKKLFIANSCVELIKQLKSHRYKGWDKDWDVVKEKDDLLDSMRYIITSIRSPFKIKTDKEEKLDKLITKFKSYE